MALSRIRRRAAAVLTAAEVLARAAERVSLTVTGLVCAFLLVGGWFAARAIGSRAMYLTVYGAFLTMLLAWLVTRRRLSIAIERSRLPRRMRVGQSVQVELKVTTPRRLTTMMLLEHVPPHLGLPVRIPIGSLRVGEELVHRYTITPSLRGVYAVGPVTATWNDPFGFTIHRQVVPEPEELLVHPPLETVNGRVLTRMWEDPPVRPPVSKPWPVGFEFYGMRDYVPGDDMRRVVWPVYAKTGRVMVRESEQGITDRVTIVLNTDREWHSPGEVSETFETAIKTVASLGVRHLLDGFSLNLITNQGRIESGLRGRTAELPFLDALARMSLGADPLSAIGPFLFEDARSHPHVLVVTPHLSAADAQQLKLVADRGLSVIVVQVVWEEADLSTASRAAAAGARVVQVEPGVALEAVFQSRAVARGHV